MNPRINTEQGINAIRAFASIVQYMPEDIQGWGTPQIYPFWGSGQAYSVMSFPSIYGYGNANPESVVKDKQMPCVIPATTAGGEPVRRAAEAAGTSYEVNAYSDHPELAYWFIQWLTSPSVGNRAIAHPQGFWDPYRTQNWVTRESSPSSGRSFLTRRWRMRSTRHRFFISRATTST